MAKFGPSTTNADLAEALLHLLHRLGHTSLSEDEYDALDEAVTRIGEHPDKD